MATFQPVDTHFGHPRPPLEIVEVDPEAAMPRTVLASFGATVLLHVATRPGSLVADCSGCSRRR